MMKIQALTFCGLILGCAAAAAIQFNTVAIIFKNLFQNCMEEMSEESTRRELVKCAGDDFQLVSNRFPEFVADTETIFASCKSESSNEVFIKCVKDNFENWSTVDVTTAATKQRPLIEILSDLIAERGKAREITMAAARLGSAVEQLENLIAERRKQRSLEKQLHDLISERSKAEEVNTAVRH